MRSYASAASVAAILLGLAAGAGNARADDLAIAFSFDASSKCSKVSPEIRVGNIPPGTAVFKVKLKDRDATWRHGGGTFANDGSGIIPKGALKDGYNGPCPPDRPHRYVFTVKALDADGNELAEGSAERKFP